MREILVCLRKSEAFETLPQVCVPKSGTVTAIGEVLPADPEQPQIVLKTANGERPVRSGAFDHFAS
jgi:hypothetical protein